MSSHMTLEGELTLDMEEYFKKEPDTTIAVLMYNRGRLNGS